MVRGTVPQRQADQRPRGKHESQMTMKREVWLQGVEGVEGEGYVDMGQQRRGREVCRTW